jgi:hypothetical protein
MTYVKKENFDDSLRTPTKISHLFNIWEIKKQANSSKTYIVDYKSTNKF